MYQSIRRETRCCKGCGELTVCPESTTEFHKKEMINYLISIHIVVYVCFN